MHFPDMTVSLGGGEGHAFVETSRRDLTESEAIWWQGKPSWVNYTYSKCGFSYNEVE